MEEKKLSNRDSSIRSISDSLYSLRILFGKYVNNSVCKFDILKAFFGPKLTDSRGFTLIEIITAIGVLTILSSLILAAVNPIEQFRKAQDAKRKSDLAQIQRALEAYYQDFGRYPAHTSAGLNTYTINSGDGEDNNAIDWGTRWDPYMDLVPVDPHSDKFYVYESDSTNGYQSYRIYASLDRGTKDPEACSEATGCPNAPGGCGLGDEIYCNFGLTSPNVSP